LIILLCNANQQIKELIERGPKPYLSPGDLFYVTKSTDADYIAQKIASHYVSNGGGGADGHAVVLLLNVPEIAANALRTDFPGPLFLTLLVPQQSQVREYIRVLVRQLMSELRHARKLLQVIKKEVQERDTRTPVLLPVRNFASAELIDLLVAIQQLRPVEPDYGAAFRALIVEAENRGLRSVSVGRSSYFENSREIRFSGPSKAGARHGRPSFVPPHIPACLVSGYVRLGARYDERFHYDCEHRRGGITGDFEDCHGAEVRVPPCSHVNIAPNDHVRR
jgi:hypothetical protein